MARKISDFWEILKYIQGLPADITEAIGAIAKSEQASADNLLGAIVDQIAYNSQDYQRLRGWIRDWYASHRTIGTFQMGVSDPYSLPNDQTDDLFQSFGYNLSASIRNPVDNETPLIKTNFFLDLVNLYKIKGSPQTIVDVLQYYGLTELDVYEFDLQFEDRPLKDANDLIFKGLITAGTTDPSVRSPLYLPYQLLTAEDPHWLLRESQIRTLYDLNNINFPSRSPYFAIKPIFDDRSLGVSVASLVRACVMYFNKLFAPVGYKGPNFLCYDGTSVLVSDILDEWDALTGKQTTRLQQKQNLIAWYDTFTRLTPSNFLQDILDAQTILTTINPTFVTNLNNLAKSDLEILGTLLDDLGLWIRSELSYGFANIAYVMFGIDSLFSDLREVVEFFKPYRARFIPIENLEFSSRLTETIIVEDENDTIGVDLLFHDFLTANSKPCCGDETIDTTSNIDCTTTYESKTQCGRNVVSAKTPNGPSDLWASSTLYLVNDLVNRYDPSTKYVNQYICIKQHTSNLNINQPVTGTDWTTYWEVYSQVICTDSTSLGLFYSRDTYDCGSYHDIGAVSDLPTELFIQQEELIHEGLNCVPNEEGTAIVTWEILESDTTGIEVAFFDTTATDTIHEATDYYQTGGFSIFDAGGTFDCTHAFDYFTYEIEQVTGYLLKEDGGKLLTEDGGGILL